MARAARSGARPPSPTRNPGGCSRKGSGFRHLPDQARVRGVARKGGRRFAHPYLLTPQTDDRTIESKQTVRRRLRFSEWVLLCWHVHGLRRFQLAICTPVLHMIERIVGPLGLRAPPLAPSSPAVIEIMRASGLPGDSLTPMVEPGTLLSVADELAAGASDGRGRAVAAVLAAHGALETLVNQVGGEEIASFNYRARFLPKWHDLCERTLGRQLEAASDLERLQALRDGARVPGRAREARPPVPRRRLRRSRPTSGPRKPGGLWRRPGE